MSGDVTPIRPDLDVASAPADESPSPSTEVHYVDDDRDYRDCIVRDAVNGAISLIEAEERAEAAAVLRLVRDRLDLEMRQTDKFKARVRP